MKEIENIIDFSMPYMENYLRDGKKIYDFVEEHVKIFPVGVVPLSNECGYLFLKMQSGIETKVYEYQVSIFENPDERFRGIHMHFLKSYEKSLLNTFESIKSDLLRYNKNLPNPATYVIESSVDIPFEETFLPIAKRVLVKRIAGNA